MQANKAGVTLQPSLAEEKGNALDIESLKITHLNASVTIEIHILVPNGKTFSADER